MIDKMILIRENKTWVEALNYCRENYADLASILDHDEQRWIQIKAKKASTSHIWMGLRYTCMLEFWFWVNDGAIKYANWASNGKTEQYDVSGAMDSGGKHEWFSKLDTEMFNFVCSKV